MAAVKFIMISEDGLSSLPIVNGQLIVVKETGQIYTDIDGARLSYTSSAGGGLIDVTYEQLMVRMNEGMLIPGSWYRITDYRTIYAQAGYGTVMGKEGSEYPSELDPLIVLATSNSAVSEEAYSTKHPEDKIWYSPHNDTSRFTWATPEGKGVIYRRIDDQRNQTGYDHRNIRFRRYKIKLSAIPEWSESQVYNAKSVVKREPFWGNWVYANVATNVGMIPGDPSSGSGTDSWARWVALFPNADSRYYMTNSGYTAVPFNGGASLQIMAEDTYVNMLTFWQRDPEDPTMEYDYHLPHDNVIMDYYEYRSVEGTPEPGFPLISILPRSLPNIVFHDPGAMNNTIGVGCTLINIFGSSSNNVIGKKVQNCWISGNYNIIGNGSGYMSVSGNRNTLGIVTSATTLEAGTEYNTVGDGSKVLLGDGSKFNQIGSGAMLSLGATCLGNQIAPQQDRLYMGNYCSNNTIGSSVQQRMMGAGFRNNTVMSGTREYDTSTSTNFSVIPELHEKSYNHTVSLAPDGTPAGLRYIITWIDKNATPQYEVVG